jgi:heptaprenyl diphosphate synthase
LARASDDPADADLKETLSKPIHDEVLLQQTLARLREHKAMDQARERLSAIAYQAEVLLNEIPNSTTKDALATLIGAIIKRFA